MKRSDVKAFLERDWARVRELKARYWAERKHELPPEEVFAVAEGLRQQVLALRPGWPDQSEREADLQVHTRVSGCLRRVRSPAGT